jgi:hypothetical protein
MGAMSSQIEILDPTAAPRVVPRPLATRQRDLVGSRIGFLSNKKANADLLLAQLDELLRDRVGSFESVWASKSAPIPASDEVIRELSSCAAVVTAVAD